MTFNRIAEDNKMFRYMKKRKTYDLYEFGGLQMTDTLPKVLRCIKDAAFPTDEWKIIDRETGEIVVEKHRQIRLIEFVKDEDGDNQMVLKSKEDLKAIYEQWREKEYGRR